MSLLGADPPDSAEVNVPFRLNSQNNIVVRATLNEEDSLSLMLHTAVSDLMLTEEAVRKTNTIQFSDSIKMKSWGGEANSRVSKANQLQMGTLVFTGIDIFEDKNSGMGTDGKFGLDLFQNRIVEINFDSQNIILYDSLPQQAEQFERIKVVNQGGMLLVQGTCSIDDKDYNNLFLIHSGYAGGILLDDDFVASSGVDGQIKLTDEASLTDSFGNMIKIKKGIMPKFMIGSLSRLDVPVGFFSGASGTQKMSIMGCEVLRHFNLIFDISQNDLYLTARTAPFGE